MGGTYEVWIIDNGFLYEVVTHDVFATWLDGILQTIATSAIEVHIQRGGVEDLPVD